MPYCWYWCSDYSVSCDLIHAWPYKRLCEHFSQILVCGPGCVSDAEIIYMVWKVFSVLASISYENVLTLCYWCNQWNNIMHSTIINSTLKLIKFQLKFQLWKMYGFATRLHCWLSRWLLKRQLLWIHRAKDGLYVALKEAADLMLLTVASFGAANRQTEKKFWFRKVASFHRNSDEHNFYYLTIGWVILEQLGGWYERGCWWHSWLWAAAHLSLGCSSFSLDLSSEVEGEET